MMEESIVQSLLDLSQQGRIKWKYFPSDCYNYCVSGTTPKGDQFYIQMPGLRRNGDDGVCAHLVFNEIPLGMKAAPGTNLFAMIRELFCSDTEKCRNILADEQHALGELALSLSAQSEEE